MLGGGIGFTVGLVVTRASGFDEAGSGGREKRALGPFAAEDGFVEV